MISKKLSVNNITLSSLRAHPTEFVLKPHTGVLANIRLLPSVQFWSEPPRASLRATRSNFSSPSHEPSSRLAPHKTKTAKAVFVLPARGLDRYTISTPVGFFPRRSAGLKKCSTGFQVLSASAPQHSLRARKNPHRGFYLCAGEDLNLHTRRHNHLKVACLPFHHPRRYLSSNRLLFKSPIPCVAYCIQRLLNFQPFSRKT